MKHELLRRAALAGLVCTACAPAAAAAQVLVAPPVLVVSERTPFASLLIVNQTAEVQEVTVDFRFGYPVGDAAGSVGMVYGDSVPAADRSIAAGVRAFPRQFTLGPQQQQTVRITATAPPGAEPGTYWTRVITTSSAAAPPPDTSTEAVTARVIFRIEQVTTLLYRRGSVSTGLALAGDPVSVPGDAPGVLAGLRLAGNSPFLGRSRLRVLAADGSVAGEEIEYFAVYVDMAKRFAFPAGIAAGTYQCELVLTSDRPDLARDQVLTIEPLQRRFECTVP